MGFLTRKCAVLQHIPFKSQVTQKHIRTITGEYRDAHSDYSRKLSFHSIYSKHCIIIFSKHFWSNNVNTHRSCLVIL